MKMIPVFSLKRTIGKAIFMGARLNNLSCLDGIRIIMILRVAVFNAYTTTVFTTRDPDTVLFIDHLTSENSIYMDSSPLANVFIMITGQMTITL